MPVPKPFLSDGELQARMTTALQAWRRIAHRTNKARAGRIAGLRDAMLALADTGEMLDDLEKIANAFDAWPSAVSHIQDLRREIERLERERPPVLNDRDKLCGLCRRLHDQIRDEEP